MVSTGVSVEEAASRTIVIKWPDFNEREITKGILIITFTKTSSYYYFNINTKELCEYFHIVLEPSWAGYMDADIMFWAFSAHTPVWVQSTDVNDRAMLNSLTTNLLPLSFGASDWVDYQSFAVIDETPIYDSVYVANTNPIKRVYRYLIAIRKIIDGFDREYKGLLICADWGEGREEIMNMIKQLKLENQCDVMFSLGKKELILALNKSKVNVLLSFKEGSNRSLFESMFCNIPVIVLAENIGVNKSYINEFTGLLVLDSFFEDSLIYMKANYDKYSPRKWALNNITPEITTKKLAEAIALKDKLQISESDEMLVKVNNPEVSYLGNNAFPHDIFNIKLLEIFGKKSQIADKSGELKNLRLSFYSEFGR
jgi:glycosyltransferase involved in cell wall biosynthesis